MSSYINIFFYFLFFAVMAILDAFKVLPYRSARPSSSSGVSDPAASLRADITSLYLSSILVAHRPSNSTSTALGTNRSISLDASVTYSARYLLISVKRGKFWVIMYQCISTRGDASPYHLALTNDEECECESASVRVNHCRSRMDGPLLIKSDRNLN